MYRLATLTIIFIALVTANAAVKKVVYIHPGTKIYADNLQWQRVDNELKTFLKENYKTESGKSMSLELLSEMKYQPYTVILLHSGIVVELSDGRIFEFENTLSMNERLVTILELSSIQVCWNSDGTCIVKKNIMAGSSECLEMELVYSEVTEGSWVNTTITEGAKSYNHEKSLCTYTFKLGKIRGETEFVLKVRNGNYDYWDNNEGKNYSLN